jgi:uncharacterized surface protein with fasciclin (FAS1) repeats
MKTEKRSRLWMLAAGTLFAGASVFVSCTDKYDLDERMPDGFGSSIYGWLSEQSNYTNTVRLIDDLGYKEVLAKTGSKTLFAANDDAFKRFYEKNDWGVKSYDDLSPAQKKMLLFGNMIDNSIQVNALSTIQGNPLRERQCMRRFSSLGQFDTVPVLKPEQMPDNIYWKRHRESGKEMVCLEDGTSVPLILFLESHMTNNRITNDDYNFLTNYTTNRQEGDASVNGVKMIEQNVRCGNGFIHVMDEVITPLPNMGEVIASKPQVSMFNKLLERFCAPYPDNKRTMTNTVEYNRLYEKNVDTVYTKHFFNNKSGVAIDETPDGGSVPAQLRFDPEWNSYYSASFKSATDGNAAEQRDMAVMMVPTNKAMEEYWNGVGKPLSENYASWDDVEDDVIIELLNMHMLPSFLSSVPSKFDGVLNDANDPMGLKKEDVDSVWLACNGAIYQTNKMFSPTAYVCVSFPALIDRNMKIIYWAIKQCQYDNYLKALGTSYSLFIPTNNSLLEYIDPCSYAKDKLQLLSFRWNPTLSENERVSAVVYNYDPVTGERDSVETIRGTKDYPNSRIKSCLRDILDTHIVMGKIWEGKNTYFRTKNGTGIRVTNPTDPAHMTVEGSYQMNEGKPLTISRVWDQRKEVTGGNGVSYVLNDQPILGTRMTVKDQLAAHPKYFKAFLELLEGSGLFEDRVHDVGAELYKATGGTNLSVFNTYHYTIYVPSNESIEALQKAGTLSTWDQVETKREAGDLSGATRDSLGIVNFLKYHIQDNALYIGAENESGEYETSLINDKTRRFMMLKSSLKDDVIEVRDANDQNDASGATFHKVQKLTYVDDDGKEKPLYNIQAREYLYEGENPQTATQLYTTSSAVIHLIDKPLSFGN